MGAWSAGISGNDTAQDLRLDYTAAFWYYDVPEALEKIDGYVRTMFDESDEEEWCCYIYSLAEFMWKKGILTDAIRDKALAMIDSGFGLEIWREAGEKTLQKRQKALEEFRELLLSPLPPKKRIKPDVHTEDVYAAGDVLALQFQTKDKPYTCGKTCPIPEGAFEALDGKYFLVQKLVTHKSWHSVIVPEVADHWLIMRLFDGIYDEPPVLTDISVLKPITVSKFADGCGFPVFVMESSKFYFKRRKAVLLTNDSTGTDEIPGCMMQEHIFFGVNKPWYNPDSILAASLLRELK